MSASIEVDFAGIHFINPFILSSAPPTTTGDMIEKAFEEGWGGAVIKTLAYDISQAQNVNPRIHSVKQDGRIIGFSNFELGSYREIDVWLKDIPRIKKRFPKNILLVSLLHTEGLIKEEWVEVAEKCAEAGVDGFELNFSCSHGMAESGGGATIASNVELIKEVLGWVREAVDLPIMVKLPAVVENLPYKAKTAEENGADAISTINTINCLPGIDIYNFTPYPQVDGKSAFSGLSGSVIKPIGLRCVAGIAQEVNIPVSGMGGISNWEDAVQYLLAGASTVQVCSAVMQYGYRIINDLKQGLRDYMEEMNFKTIDDFKGLALKNIEKHNSLSRKYRLVSQVDPDKCVGCGLCSRVCKDSAYQAIEMSDKRIPIIDENKCDGCGLCNQICPIMGAMKLVRK
ncbi:MAG: NAD-dependent dihydropyrimidine dehydrogenase subunit PreA [Candidatus Heimdallarchaeaceae archaeon]